MHDSVRGQTRVRALLTRNIWSRRHSRPQNSLECGGSPPLLQLRHLAGAENRSSFDFCRRAKAAASFRTPKTPPANLMIKNEIDARRRTPPHVNERSAVLIDRRGRGDDPQK